MQSASRSHNDTDAIVCGTGYGNVMAIRSSVIPLKASQIRNNGPISVTNPAMKRLITNFDDALDLVLYAFNNASNGGIFVWRN